jgi:hypothetical protein
MRKKEAREKRQKQELVLDEVAPKETGREAQLAKKRAQNAYHKRERSPDVELNESDIYGDDRSRYSVFLTTGRYVTCRTY